MDTMPTVNAQNTTVTAQGGTLTVNDQANTLTQNTGHANRGKITLDPHQDSRLEPPSRKGSMAAHGSGSQ
jgi:hypothetical protein